MHVNNPILTLEVYTIATIALKYDLECDFVYSNNSLMIIQQCISWTQK